MASPQSGYAPLEVAFTDASLKQPTSWQWMFGDGGFSLERDRFTRLMTREPMRSR